jgi:AcrR family transcriptional regulator
MPRLWTDTIETHRQQVRNAILDAAGALMNEHGLRAVTMSRIAEEAGVGRATLYKYFPDLEAVLHASHERHVTEHLHHLTELASRGDGADKRLEAVLVGYALICYHRARAGTEDLGALLHRGETVARAERQLQTLFQDLLAEAASRGDIRDDVAPKELAAFCLHALSAAGSLSSEAATKRLVAVTLSALRPMT